MSETRQQRREKVRFEKVWAKRLDRNPMRRPARVTAQVEVARVVRKRPNGVEYVDFIPMLKPLKP